MNTNYNISNVKNITKEYKNLNVTISKSSKDFEKLGRTLKQMSGSFSKNTKYTRSMKTDLKGISVSSTMAAEGIDDLVKEQQKMSSKMIKGAQVLKVFQWGLQGIAAIADPFLKYEESLFKAGAALSLTNEELADYGDTITYEFSQVKTQQGSNVLTCGYLVSISCDFPLRENRLATITDLLSDSLAAYADSAANAGEYNDVLMTTAQQTGLSMAGLQSGLGSVLPAAGKMGIGIEQVTGSLRCA